MISKKSWNLIRMGCKTHIFYNLLKDCHISFLLEVPYIISHLITSQEILNLVEFQIEIRIDCVWLYLFFNIYLQFIAEVIGTFFVIFAGCGSVVVNKIYGLVTFPGICVTWGLIVMVMIYTVGHISGAHFNPAVTITFAVFRRFPYKQVIFFLRVLLNIMLKFAISS